jgi:hypothetical protein
MEELLPKLVPLLPFNGKELQEKIEYIKSQHGIGYVDILWKALSELRNDCDFTLDSQDEKFVDKPFHCFPIQSDLSVYAVRYIKSDDIRYAGLTIKNHCPNSCIWKYMTYKDAVATAIDFILSHCEYEKLLYNNDETMLYKTILSVSNHIAYSTHRGCGNFIIAAPWLCEKIVSSYNKQASYPFSKDTDKIVRHTFMKRDLGNKIIVGYVGKQANDAGIILHERENMYLPIMSIYNTEKYYKVIEYNG